MNLLRSKEVTKSGFEIPNSCAHENKNATLKKIFPHREALAESVGFKSRMMSFDKVKTFTNNLGPLFGHDAINRKAVRLRAIERKYKNSRYFSIGFWFCGLFWRHEIPLFSDCCMGLKQKARYLDKN